MILFVTPTSLNFQYPGVGAIEVLRW